MEAEVKEKTKTPYSCKECGMPAIVEKNGTIHRTCEHKTTVVLDLEVVVYGESQFSG